MLKKALAACSVVAMTAIAVPPTAQADHEPGHPGEWQTITNETYIMPRGWACADRVVEKANYRFRETMLPNGWILAEFDHTSRSTFKNMRNGKSFTVPTGGDLVARQLRAGKVVKIWATGSNIGQGKGSKGIPWSRGDIDVTLYNPGNPKKMRHTVDFKNARVVNVCRKLGSRPVWGRNVEPQPSPSADGGRRHFVP
jgi:hypothetical protein